MKGRERREGLSPACLPGASFYSLRATRCVVVYRCNIQAPLFPTMLRSGIAPTFCFQRRSPGRDVLPRASWPCSPKGMIRRQMLAAKWLTASSGISVHERWPTSPSGSAAADPRSSKPKDTCWLQGLGLVLLQWGKNTALLTEPNCTPCKMVASGSELPVSRRVTAVPATVKGDLGHEGKHLHASRKQPAQG